MDATHQALLRELPQVAADRILGHAEADHELRGDHPAVTLNRREDRLSAFSRQHAACYSTKMQVFAGISSGELLPALIRSSASNARAWSRLADCAIVEHGGCLAEQVAELLDRHELHVVLVQVRVDELGQ